MPPTAGSAAAARQPALSSVSDEAGRYRARGDRLALKGQLELAAQAYARVLEINPDDAVAHSNLGAVLIRLGALAEAGLHLSRAVELAPDLADAYSNQACLLVRLGRFSEAGQSARRCLELKPSHVEGWINLGGAFAGAGFSGQAKRCLLQAAKLAPNRARVWLDLADLLWQNREFELALKSCQRALALDPAAPQAQALLGAVQSVLHGPDAGIVHLVRALAFDPRNPATLDTLGELLAQQGKPEAAQGAYLKALEVGAGARTSAIKLKLAALAPVIPESTAEILAWRKRADTRLAALVKDDSLKLTDPYREVSLVSFYQAYHGLNEAGLNRRFAEVYLKACPELGWTAPHCQNWKRPRHLRLGMITAFEQTHIVGELYRAIARLFDRRRFEVFGLYSPRLGKDPRSIAPELDGVVSYAPALAPARAAIAEARLDVLFYLDVFMDPFSYFLSFARLAPIQCTTWGHPLSTGVPNMDYFISAEDWEVPGAEAHYTERLVRLKALPMYFERPPVPERAFERERLGVDREARLYLSLQSLFKLHPDFDAALAGVLRRDSKGVVLLLSGNAAHWDALFRRRFEQAFPDVAARVFLLPKLTRRDYLALLKASDAVLDPFHWSGGNTTLEALACGVPVPTLASEYLRGRLTLGFYRRMGIAELVVQSCDEFVDLNVRIANDRPFRQVLQAAVEERLARLWQDQGGIEALEEFFLETAEKKESQSRSDATDIA